MSMRDAGWIQLYAETNQEAVDLHIQALRLAEELSVPVMVCVDGFILTHAFERVDMPDPGPGRRLRATYEPRQVLDPAEPVSIGAMVGPEAFTEVRYLAHYRQMQALWLIPSWPTSSANTSAARRRPGLSGLWHRRGRDHRHRARLGQRHGQGRGRQPA
jgi:pyruvate ferredoxin oxidoreductase alpha subunit